MFIVVKVDKVCVMDYIYCFDNFFVDEIFNVCIEVGLFEEVFEVFKKIDNKEVVVNVFVEYVVSIDCVQVYVEEVDIFQVWSRVVKVQFDGFCVSDLIEFYIKVEDFKNYEEVIEIVVVVGKNEEFIKYLCMVCKIFCEFVIDIVFVFCYVCFD